MLKLIDVSKSFGGDIILQKINFTLSQGEHVGLIGPNGAGKSTLLRLITKLERPDSGKILLEPSVKVGYLAQALAYAPDATIASVVSEAIGPALNILDEIEKLGEAIAQNPEPELLERYGEILDEAERLDAYNASARLAQVLAGLNLEYINEDTLVATLSGGQKTRLGLARLLLAQPDLLLLDEPTNHLDITALDWLQKFVQNYKGAVLVVSHDRAFLDAIVNKIFAIDATTHTIKEYAGNYSDYAEQVERQRQKLLEDYRRQQEHIHAVEADIAGIYQHARNIEHETIHFYFRKRAAKVARAGVVRQRKLEKLLDSDEKIDKPKQTWKMKLDFGEPLPSGQIVLSMDNISKSFGERKLFENVRGELRQGERVTLLGPNGAGKTTLLRIISGQLAPDSGTVRLGVNVRVGFFSQEQENLDGKQNVIQSLRAVAAVSEADARNFLHFFLFSGDDVFKAVSQLSYGERARLVLGRLVLSGVNFLMLDEPFNHLDIDAREKFEQALDNFDGTVLAVVHDRYFVQQFAESIWAITNEQLKVFADLDDYEQALLV